MVYALKKASMKVKDPLSGLTHFLAIILAIIGMAVLIYKSSSPVKPWHIVTFSIYGAGMIFLYGASTLYHWLPLSEKGTHYLRKLDHMMIFVLIAATYTPFCLIPMRGPWGWSLFGLIWALALLGIFFKLFWIEVPRWLTALLYVGMGWMALIGIVPLVKAIEFGALAWVLVGGILYSLGAIIYAIKKPDPWPSIFGFHEIFHVFVVFGSGAYFWVMLKYILPMQ